MMRNENLLTRAEAATYLRVKYGTLANWAYLGRYNIPVVKIGGKAMYRRADLDRWLRARTVS